MATPVVGLTATPHATLGRVTLNWTWESGQYLKREATIYRRLYGSASSSAVSGNVGAATTYTDTTAAVDTNYEYRIYTVHRKIGDSSDQVNYTAWVAAHTIPVAPSNLAIVRSNNKVVLTWQPKSNSPAVGYRLVRTNPQGWGGTVGAGVGTATDSSAPNTGALTYAVRPYYLTAGLVFSEAYGMTSVDRTITTPVPAAPFAPTVTPSAYTIDASSQPLTINIKHNSSDWTLQTAGNLRWRRVGTTTWTTISLGTASSYLISIGTLSNDSDWEFQAQTAGLSGTMSAWSTSIVVATLGRPSVTITSPAAGATINTATVTITWAYSEPAGRSQVGWSVQLLVGGTQVQGKEGTGDASSWVSNPVANNTTYTVNVWVQSSAGLWSVVSTRTFSTLFIAPPSPQPTAQFDPDQGAVTLTVINPAPGGGQAATAGNRFYRDGLLVADLPGANTVWTDYTPPLNRDGTNPVPYTVVAYSAGGGGVSPGVDTTIETLLGGDKWLFLNGGPDYAVVGRMREAASVAHTPDFESSVVWFEGSPLPVEFLGQAVNNVFRVQGEVTGMGPDTEQIGTWQAFEQLAALPASSDGRARYVYRDPLGRRIPCSVSGWQIVHDSNSPEASIGFTATEVQP